MNIVFRVDASKQIGTGHVMRCLTLANALSANGHTCRFVCRDHDGNMNPFVRSKGFEVNVLKNDPKFTSINSQENPRHANWLCSDWRIDFEQFMSVIKNQVDLLIVDHYGIDDRWERLARQTCKRIFSIDDLADRRHDCDFLLDQNFLDKKNLYKQLTPDKTVFLLGPKYALIRDEFRFWRDRSIERRSKRAISKVLISMGGVDATNATLEVILALEKSDLQTLAEIKIVLPRSAPHYCEVENLVTKSKLKITMIPGTDNMAALISFADLVIGAGGVSTWERFCLGAPSITVIVAENQRSLAINLQNKQLSIALEQDQISAELPTILNTISDERLASLCSKTTKICDGEGVNRILKIIEHIE